MAGVLRKVLCNERESLPGDIEVLSFQGDQNKPFDRKKTKKRPIKTALS
jgi:hypothetical protein